jgi:16S rRNA (cytosine967-C5)-methyltransferase
MSDIRRTATDLLYALLHEDTHHGLPPARTPDHVAAHAMVLTAVRHLGQIDTVLASAMSKPLAASKAWVQCALRIGVAQQAFMRTADHAAIHETVATVRRSKFKALAPMVNAVLRAVPLEHVVRVSPVKNLPEWLRVRWEETYGKETTRAICDVAQHVPSTDICWRGDAAPSEIIGDGFAPNMLRLNGDGVWHKTEAFARGALYAQDIAASLPVRMLGDLRGARVLEIGAAPGGKTAQLCDAGAQVVALDKSPARLVRFQENMVRLKIDPHVHVVDVFEFAPIETLDAIVLDAPCSATGTWRKHPEVVHRAQPETIAELAALQARMLQHVWPWLKPGGRLLYCVCSLEPEEGETQMAAFLQQQPAAQVITPAPLPVWAQGAITPENYLRTHPAMLADRGGMDGFFACVLQKR